MTIVHTETLPLPTMRLAQHEQLTTGWSNQGGVQSAVYFHTSYTTSPATDGGLWAACHWYLSREDEGPWLSRTTSAWRLRTCWETFVVGWAWGMMLLPPFPDAWLLGPDFIGCRKRRSWRPWRTIPWRMWTQRSIFKVNSENKIYILLLNIYFFNCVNAVIRAPPAEHKASYSV